MLNEEVHLENGTSLWVLPQAMDCNDEYDDRPAKFSRDALSSYITRYSTRQFTYQNDALAAFSGILRRMEFRNNQKFHWALPYDLFDQALTWRYGSGRRVELCRLMIDDESYKVRFPSWSWLGWTGFLGGVIFNYDLDNERIAGRCRSEIDFYRLYADGHVELIVDHSQKSLRAPRERQSDTKDPLKPKLLRQGADSSQSHQWRGPVPTEIASDIQIPETMTNLPTHVNLASVDTGRLVFWTSYAQLLVYAVEHDEMTFEIAGRQIKIKITEGTAEKEFDRRVRASIEKSKSIKVDKDGAENPAPADPKDNMENFDVKAPLNDGGVECAETESKESSNSDINPPSVTKNQGDVIYAGDSSDCDSVATSDVVPVMMDFVVISRYWPVGVAKYDKPESVNLLIVKFSKHESEVAQRIGSATIVEQDWIAAEREWRRIILE